MIFRGITFEEQEVTPEDDGRLFQALFTDGILYGCAISNAGYTLTIDPGYLMIAGRQIKIPQTQHFAVAGSADGYARLVLTIDLNQPSTATDFRQITAGVEYAETIDGFADIVQGDINGKIDKIYQTVMAVCSLTSVGIAAIVDILQDVNFR